MGFPTTGGSINEVGWRFQSFRINDLEMVVQICPTWNRLADWLREAEGYARGGVQALDQASIGLASATFEIGGLPPLRIANAIRSSEGGLDQGSGASATND